MSTSMNGCCSARRRPRDKAGAGSVPRRCSATTASWWPRSPRKECCASRPSSANAVRSSAEGDRLLHELGKGGSVVVRNPARFARLGIDDDDRRRRFRYEFPIRGEDLIGNFQARSPELTDPQVDADVLAGPLQGFDVLDALPGNEGDAGRARVPGEDLRRAQQLLIDARFALIVAPASLDTVCCQKGAP